MYAVENNVSTDSIVFSVKIDTGASCNVISINDYDVLSKAQPTQCMNKCNTKLMSYGGHNLSVKR